ncbi:MAG: GWxTD domain-containing protein [Longimicrobiales bacterium]
MRWLIHVLVLLLAVPIGLSAQQRTVEQLRDSLRGVSDVASLRRRESVLARGLRYRESAVLSERGLILLRLFELTGRNGDGDDARECFERLLRSEPDNAWAHFGLGLALAGGPGVRVPTPGGVLDGFVLGQSLAEVAKLDPRSRAGRQFLKALELDPTLAAAAVELAELALLSRNKDLLQRSHDVLHKMVADGLARTGVATALARVQSALGKVADAEATVAQTATADAGARTLLAQAEALLRQPGKAVSGAAAYFEGIDRTDASAVEAYFEDIRIIANQHELAEWRTAGLDERRQWLKAFWDVRAAASGKTVADRLAEHYRRLADAQERFRRTGKRGGAPLGSLLQVSYDPEQLPFDERGIIYVRHGEPDRIIRTSNADLRANESWVYTLPSGQQQAYHFVVLRDGTDYRLVDDVLQALDPSAQDFPYDGVVQMLEDRAPVDARYHLLAARFNSIRNTRWGASAANIQCVAAGGTNCTGPGSAAGMMADGASGMLQTIAQTRQAMAVENREATLSALATDSDRPIFDSPLPFYYDVYTFKGRERQTDVTAAIAIPGSSLEPRTTNGALIYSLQLSLMVIDTLSGRVTRRDTVHQFRSDRRLGDGEHLRVHTDLTAAASGSTIHRLVIRDLGRPGRGQMYGGTTTVPAYDAPSLLLSDIVLAEPDPGAWHRGEAVLALVPPRQFLEGQPLTLFYELYNLQADAPYRTEITLEPTAQSTGFGKLKRLLGAGDGSLRLRFDGVARVNSAGHVQEIRRVTTELKPGKYNVRVRVTNLANQQVAVTAKEFVVIKP